MSTALAVVAAITALISLFFVWQQVREMQRQTTLQGNIAAGAGRLQRELAEEAAQPYIWADVRLQSANGWILELVVGNSGPTVATDVRVRVEPPIPAASGAKALDDVYETLRTGLKSVAPGRTFHWSIGASPDVVNRAGNLAHTIIIDAVGPHGPLAQSQYVIDMAQWRQSLARDNGTLRDVAKMLEKMFKQMPNPRRPVQVEVVKPHDETFGELESSD